MQTQKVHKTSKHDSKKLMANAAASLHVKEEMKEGKVRKVPKEEKKKAE